MSTPTVDAPRLKTLVRPLIARTDASSHRHETWLELFFDLCFVVLVAALARALRADPTWDGALIYVGLFVPVWWAWVGWAWFANQFDNDDLPYRLATFGAMLAAIWMATSVQSAATGGGFAFALAYIVLRSLLIALQTRALSNVSAHPDQDMHEQVRGFLRRYITWNAFGLFPWIASLAVDSPERFVLWGIGLTIELYAPYAANRAERTSRRFVRISHLDHIRGRYGLFTIIVLGESVLAVSVGVGQVGWDSGSMLVASLAFVVAVSIWWVYFDRTGRAALGLGLKSALAWGYSHFAIFAGIAAVGVGAELLIELAAEGAAEHAGAETTEAVGVGGSLPGSAVFAGGLAAFIFGSTIVNLSNVGFRITPVGRVALPLRLGLIVSLVLLAWADVEPLAFVAAAAAAIVLLNVVETWVGLRVQTPKAAASLDLDRRTPSL